MSTLSVGSSILRRAALMVAIAASLFLTPLLGFSDFAQAQPQQKPNILVIFGDDIGWFNVSAYNNGIMGYRTKNID